MKTLIIRELKIRLGFQDENNSEKQINDFLKHCNEHITKLNGSPEISIDSENGEPVFEVEETCDKCGDILRYYVQVNMANPDDKSLTEIFGCLYCGS